MDFGFNQEQELLRATARKFLENECTSELVRARMAEDAGFTEDFWTKLAEQGWLGLVYPEQYGGAGLGFVDLTVLMEEMGRAGMPGPLHGGTVASVGLTGSATRRRSPPRSKAIVTGGTGGAPQTFETRTSVVRDVPGRTSIVDPGFVSSLP